jgi:hypothetical protein
MKNRHYAEKDFLQLFFRIFAALWPGKSHIAGTDTGKFATFWKNILILPRSCSSETPLQGPIPSPLGGEGDGGELFNFFQKMPND